VATLVAQTKKVLGFFCNIAQQLYDVRLARAEREVNRHRAFLRKRSCTAANLSMRQFSQKNGRMSPENSGLSPKGGELILVRTLKKKGTDHEDLHLRRPGDRRIPSRTIRKGLVDVDNTKLQ
jgi:hypothetical protein